MWQRFTETARKAVFYAQEEAQRFGESYVSTEHLLLGVLREPNTAAKILERLDVSLENLRIETEKNLPTGVQRPSQDMTLTPRGKRVIDLAYDEARMLVNNYIGTEHLLLGLIREGDGLASRVLEGAGVDIHAARKVVLELQDGSEGRSEAAQPVSRPIEMQADQARVGAGLLHAEHVLAMIAREIEPLTGVVASRLVAAMIYPPNLESSKIANVKFSDLLVGAQEEASALGQALSAAHFALAILKEGSSLASQVLLDSGVTYDFFRAKLLGT